MIDLSHCHLVATLALAVAHPWSPMALLEAQEGPTLPPLSFRLCLLSALLSLLQMHSVSLSFSKANLVTLLSSR